MKGVKGFQKNNTQRCGCVGKSLFHVPQICDYLIPHDLKRNVKIKTKDIQDILALRKNGFSLRKISIKYGVVVSTIWDVLAKIEGRMIKRYHARAPKSLATVREYRKYKENLILKKEAILKSSKHGPI